MLAASYGTNKDNSDYEVLPEDFPTILNSSPELKTIIEEIVHIIDVINTAVKYFSTPRVIFNQPHKIDPMELTVAETS